jgi:hypothetical protein
MPHLNKRGRIYRPYSIIIFTATSAKPKPVTGPDDLLLLLVQHWARDESIFPTEDDRLDLPTIMLFQSYTGCRPAELVHAPRGLGLQDPLDDEDTSYS